MGQPGVWQRSTPGETAIALRGIVLRTLEPVGIVFLASLAAAVAAGVVQGGGWSLNFKALSPKPERLNPLENAKNVFSLRGAVRLGKSLVPVALLGFFTARAIEAQSEIPPISVVRYPDVFAEIYNLLLDGAWIFLGWAGIDYVMEWRSREGRLRMSRQDLRDEFSGDGRQPSGEGAHSGTATADAAAADEIGYRPGFGGGHESDPLRGGAELRFQNNGAAAGAGQGKRLAGCPDPGGGAVGGRADR